MPIDEVDALLTDLADNAGDYEREAGTALLVRRGHEIMLTLREVPGAGICVLREKAPKGQDLVPLNTYVQRDILGLPGLAGQIRKTLDRIWEKRPVAFVEGPAVLESAISRIDASSASSALDEQLRISETGTTTLIQLMAAAGRGKTALLEQMSREHAVAYQPQPYPSPLMLPVDLLGRFVGGFEDAIAGTLNNTFIYPLSQRDVVLCMKRRWLVLALDGFDEIVARVGVRDAFARVTEMLDQLHGEGTVILSARESFFELYQITSAIRTYLQPKQGSYSFTVMRLEPWAEPQGETVFRHLQSQEPSSDLQQLLITFDTDRSIVFHPFFLTRLADLWMKGERFGGAAAQPDPITRAKYIIETFINRESADKWIDRDGKMLLSIEGHASMLGSIAEEMWRSGAFRLTIDELRIAAEMGLNDLNLPKHQLDEILAKLPTHCALVHRDRSFSFIHDQFLHYHLGLNLARLLAGRDRESLLAALRARELGPGIVLWIVWHWRQHSWKTESLLDWLNERRSVATDSLVKANIGHLAARMTANLDRATFVSLTNHTFVGDILSKSGFSKVRFARCEFWNLDLSDSSFEECAFQNCRFGDATLNGRTVLQRSVFEDCEWDRLTIDGDETLFSPSEIDDFLRRRGADIRRASAIQKATPLAVRWDIARCMRHFVRQSERTCDVAISDIEQLDGRIAMVVAKIAAKHGVLKTMRKAPSGPHKEFVRFQVDRDRLLRGEVAITEDATVDAFWGELRQKYPKRT